MTDEELIDALRKNTLWVTTHDAADRIEALVKERDDAVSKRAAWELEAKVQKARAARLEAAADYILDGMGIDAPDYEVDPDDDFLDAANSDWVRDTLTRLAAALKGADHDQ